MVNVSVPFKTLEAVVMCRRHFSQLLNVHGVNDGRQTEIHTAESLLSEPSAFEVELLLKI